MDFWIGFAVGCAVLPVCLALFLLVEFLRIGAQAFRATRSIARAAAGVAMASHVKDQLIRAGRAREVVAAEKHAANPQADIDVYPRHDPRRFH